MKNSSSFSKLLTPILIVMVLLFAGMVTFASYYAYQRGMENVENYTHAQMRGLILDLESKLMPIESALLIESHRSHVSLEDSASLYEHLEECISEQKFVRHAGVDFWFEDREDSLSSYTIFVTQMPDGSFIRDFVHEEDKDVGDMLMDSFMKAYRNGTPTWTRPYYDPYLAKSTVLSCYQKTEDVWAMWGVDVEVDKLLETIDDFKFYEKSQMYIEVPDGDIYTLDGNQLVVADEINYDEDRFTRISAHYNRLDVDIINIVPNDVIYSSLWRNIFIVILIFVVSLPVLSFLVHRSFNRAQDDLAQSIKKSSEEKIAYKRIEDEIAIAADIQNRMLTSPGKPAHLVPENGLPADVMALIIPAREVGGDLYEYRMSGDYLVMCVGDVSGKGLPASMMMSMCITLFHAYVSQVTEPDPSALLSYINTQLCRRNENMMFVTLWTGVLDMRSGHLSFSSAGHNPPVMVRRGMASFMELCQGVPLGMFDASVYPLRECDLKAGDTILLYTDGITEAEGPGNDLFGDDRLLEVCSSIGSQCPEVICHSVLNAVIRHADGCVQSDDITLLGFSFGSGTAQLHGIDEVKALHRLVADSGQDDMAALVLEEAAVNEFRHGGAHFVHAAYRDGVFILSSDGGDFNPTTYKVPNLEDGELRIGGRGIPLIRQLCPEATWRRTEYGINIQTFKFS